MTNPFEREDGTYVVLMNNEASIRSGRHFLMCRPAGPSFLGNQAGAIVLNISARIGAICGRTA
ncbi:hypothetical protein ACH95_16520 [Bacillus glycinifermentans]|nr:hypothetical protein ACH95_16520 [Bacillus glycinifermentans]